MTAWPALAVRARAHAVTLHGTDLAHPRSRRLTLAALPLLDLTACVSQELADEVPRRAVRGRPVAVLPCGVDMDRFVPIERDVARRELELDPDDRYLLFRRSGRGRHDPGASIAQAVGVELLSLGNVSPERVPLYINAANAVLVTSEREGFGLAVLEALACDVPVLATPHGVAVEALSGVAGTYCGEFEVGRWRAELAPHLLELRSARDRARTRWAVVCRGSGRARRRGVAGVARVALARSGARQSAPERPEHPGARLSTPERACHLPERTNPPHPSGFVCSDTKTGLQQTILARSRGFVRSSRSAPRSWASKVLERTILARGGSIVHSDTKTGLERTMLPHGAGIVRSDTLHGSRLLGDPRRVAMVEHQRVAVGVGEERHVAHARVERVAGEADAAASSVGARRVRRRRRAARSGWG